MTTKPPSSEVPAPQALAPRPLSPESPHWVEVLSDGTHVLIRPIGKADAGLERDFIRRLSPQSRRLRFLGQIGEPSAELIRRLTDIDYEHDMALVALLHRDGAKQEVGVARYGVSADGSCECAVTVSDEWQNRGLATVLMTHLIAIARDRGIREMVSIDLAENGAMRDLAAGLGFRREPDPDDAMQVIHRLTL
ncbi:GNAT family N-acetyltransferase [Tahibacter caeni]|uniref:GNAT family N-acetyltransferase n=1 Tax=Tahibacter caeni TaxID=1453545 RepID=UPI0021484C19|nr:GNAT family N-acetyltransferase [Tahibacter caeni]